jgi:membrane-bound lytic murein transglycosylase D
MDRQPRGGWAGAPDLDPGLRDAAVASLAGWRRRLENSGALSNAGQVRQELATIGKEASDLRAFALSRGATALAQHLERIATAAGGAGHAVADALEQLARHVGPAESRAVHSVLQPSLTEPPLLDLSQAKSLPQQGTLLSGRSPSSPAPAAPHPQGVAPPSVLSQPSAVSPPPVVPPPGRQASAPPIRLPDSIAPPQPQPSFVGTFLGFRAFGRKRSEADRGEPRAAKAAGDVLGLRGRLKAGPTPSTPPIPPAFAGTPPRQPLQEPANAHARWGSRRPPEVWTPPRHRKGSRTSMGEAALPRWFYALGGVLGVLVVATIFIIVRSVRGSSLLPDPMKPPANAVGASTTANAANGFTPAPGAIPTGPANAGASATATPGDAVIFTFQPKGKETPELRALLETQSRLAQACRTDPATCGRGWTPLSRDAFNPIDRSSLQLEPAPTTPLPAWLQRLKLPSDLPVRDDASLRAMFDFNTKNIAGRQRFQAKLFECAAYDDIFDSTLVKYGAPSWLTAVVFQESACYPRAKSEVGALGLWQFMPESARAYGLRVVEGEIDERLNPIKSTDAAIHFLTDLQRTLGAWDLVMAAYNMGPYAVLARLSQFSQGGGSAGFWDLVHAGMLPEETAGYVPAIEAYALALQNLSKLHFSREGKRLEATAEINVKPGERLSLLARAASTTTLHVRELNPEFLRDVIPEGETTARVPDAESHRAQAFLESWSPDDNRDTCVPEDFDWGVKEFESSKFAKGCDQPASP